MKAVSCNGCRILRKACPEDWTIRQCLLGIGSPESQANATLFIAKFYGLSGLSNLIKASHESQRHSLLSSLLYEACGRILNPVYGSLGLLHSGDWSQCVATVRSVLRGSSTAGGNNDETESIPLPLAGCDIRHVSNKSILPIKNPRKASTTTRPKRAVPAVDSDVCTSTSTEAKPRPKMAKKRKLDDFSRDLLRTEDKEEESEEQKISHRRPSMPNLASLANLEDDDHINFELSPRRNRKTSNFEGGDCCYLSFESKNDWNTNI